MAKRTTTTGNANEPRCFFCGRSQDDGAMLLQGQKGYICTDCIYTAADYLKQMGVPNPGAYEDEEQKGPGIDKDKGLQLLRPKEINDFLDQYVIGQDRAKKLLSVAVYNHYKRIKYNESHQGTGKKGSKRLREISDVEGVEIEKSNILLVGPTGTGKTLLARTIARLLNVPFAIVDATVLTEAGYVGEDVENILTRLLQDADYDVAMAEKGIVFVDEIDKIARKGDNPSITRDVSGEGVQQAMLKLLEGTVVNVPPKGGRKHPEQAMVPVNTKDILFICGGAFEGIEKIIGQRLNTQVIGFGAQKIRDNIDTDNLLKYIAPQDLRSYGLIPEIIGRLPIIATLVSLDRQAMLDILTKPKNAIIKQFDKIFELDGIKLVIDDKVLDLIVDTAIRHKLGARGLRSICEAIMTDAMYEAPTSSRKEFRVTLDYAKKHLTTITGEALS